MTSWAGVGFSASGGGGFAAPQQGFPLSAEGFLALGASLAAHAAAGSSFWDAPKGTKKALKGKGFPFRIPFLDWLCKSRYTHLFWCCYSAVIHTATHQIPGHRRDPPKSGKNNRLFSGRSALTRLRTGSTSAASSDWLCESRYMHLFWCW